MENNEIYESSKKNPLKFTKLELKNINSKDHCFMKICEFRSSSYQNNKNEYHNIMYLGLSKNGNIYKWSY